MRRIAILAIAALNRPVYRHYVASYWTDLIRYTNAQTPHVDVYLLNEHGRSSAPFGHIAENVIEDPDRDLEQLVPERFQTPMVPGILSKTVHALDVLAGRYDVFFRTNLSSMVRLSMFDRFVQSRVDLGYSGAFVWRDALRSDLLHHDRVGPDRSVQELSELDGYPGNTFISGSGYFLSASDAQYLVDNRARLRYDLPDDVAVGLMFERYEHLPGFTETIRADVLIADALERLRRSSAPHVRLEHLPVERARALWRYVAREQLWR